MKLFESISCGVDESQMSPLIKVKRIQNSHLNAYKNTRSKENQK